MPAEGDTGSGRGAAAGHAAGGAGCRGLRWRGWRRPAFLASRLHQNAVIRALEVLGEAAGKVSAGCRAAHPELPWREMTAMRHRLIHGYAEVRLDLVWTVARDHLPGLIAALAPLVPPDEGEGAA